MRNRSVLGVVAAATAIIGNASAENPVVAMKTNLGTMTIELDREKAPVTVANFLRYVEEGHYDGAIFHRVISMFVIQGGGFNLPADGGVPRQMRTHDPILNEAKSSGLKNLRGTISMARTQDPGSATSQFFVNVIDNSRFLDAGGGTGPDGWAVFGRVTDGLETMDRIAESKTTTQKLQTTGKRGSYPHHDVPVEPVIIEGVAIISGIEKPVRSSALLASAPLAPDTLSELGIEPAGGVAKLFTFFQSAGNMMVDVDLGETGTRLEVVIETSEDLTHWTPLPGLLPISKGTSGVLTALLPDGKEKLFLRLARTGSD